MTLLRVARWGLIYSAFMLLALGAIMLARSLLLEVQGVHTVGTVTAEAPVNGSDGDPMFQSIFVFKDAAGKDITFKSSVLSNPPDHKVGDAVKLVYRPGHPEAAMEETFFALWFFGSFATLSGLIAGAVTFFFVGRTGPSTKIVMPNAA